MRILCSNDDGIHARGLESIEKIARSLSDDVWVVAPQEEQSGQSVFGNMKKNDFRLLGHQRMR